MEGLSSPNLEKVLHLLGLEDSQSGKTPTNVKTLKADKNAPLPEENWGYVTAIGMLMYLASSNSRPNIAFAVHQCAHF